MRTLILGATGMLGHKLYQSQVARFDVYATVRSAAPYHVYGIFDRQRLVEGVDAFNFDTVVEAVAKTKPQAVINCIGIVKQLPEAHDPLRSLTVNSLLPHRLKHLCRAVGARLIHISTDCVFSGRKGMYTEDVPSDAEDLYGRTKFLGEVADTPALTLRTSIIGRELHTNSGLIEWFLSNDGGKVRGFSRAIYTGFTTNVLADIVNLILTEFPELSGVYHVSSDPISKYDLLGLVRDAFGVEVEIKPDDSVVIDRSLNSDRFRRLTGFQPPSWPVMIREMASDPTPYARWRSYAAS